MKYVAGSLVFVMALLIFTSESPMKKPSRTIPPGTVWLRDSIFIDQRPVENIHYLEYEHWMRDILNFNPDCFQRVVDTLRLFGVERDSIPFKQLCGARFEDDSLV